MLAAAITNINIKCPINLNRQGLGRDIDPYDDCSRHSLLNGSAERSFHSLKKIIPMRALFLFSLHLLDVCHCNNLLITIVQLE